MEHVSTLCAVSTLGIAATGFALGRVDRTLSGPTQLRSSTLPSHESCAPPSETYANPPFQSFEPTPPKSFAVVEPESPVATNFFRSREDAADQAEDLASRRKPSFAGVILRRRGQTLTIPPLRVDEPPSTPVHARRPSSSWIRRLSFQPEKRFSFQQPSSPSTSVAEPASPVSSNPSNPRRAPNKLVKRPKSQHSNVNPLFNHTPSSPLAPNSSRRPATSYQRSEALGHRATHSLSFEPILDFNSAESILNEAPSDPNTWQPYIGSSPNTLSERLVRRFSTTTKPKEQGLRRILPNFNVFPALLLATSITKKEPVAEVAPDDEPSNLSPVQFRDPFKPSDTPTQEPEATTLEENACQSLHADDPYPKSPTESSHPVDVRVFRNGSFVGPKRRATSTPLPELSNVEGAIWVSSRTNGRRNITDPNVFRRPPTTSQAEISAGSGIMGPQRKLIPSYCREHASELGRFRDIGQRAIADGVALSSLYGSIRQRPKRHSIAASDPASTVIGSDDTRIFTSGDEDEIDFLTDTAFDSIRTHITTNSNHMHTPRIETIFDKHFATDLTNENPTDPGDLIPPHSLVRPSLSSCHFDVDQETTSNPTLTLAPRRVPDEGDSNVSFPSDLTDDEDSHSQLAELPNNKNTHSSLSNFPTSLSVDTNSEYSRRDVLYNSGKPDIALGLRESIEHDSSSITSEALDPSLKMNIFDWSEQPKNDRDTAGPDGRPRTVHGKNGPGIRGGRASGRKLPSSLHYRSQSVPVAREPIISTESRQSGKFGTWGLGSKGVSEDWDSDFEFEDVGESSVNENINPSKSIGRPSVIVPQAIMERQASLHGQFGQVQELTLLVEELKRLRHQASFLKIVRGPSSELWKEAEGIVDLATLDDEDNNNSPPASPSSLTFSFDDSEGDSSNMNDPWKRVSGDSWRASISEHSNPRPATSSGLDHKEYSTKANSVLDLIYQRGISHDPTFDSHIPRSKKLPFDTQSLRDLVVRAGVVTRALKEVIRKAEGVAAGSDENMHPPHPPFSQIFNQSSYDDHSRFEAPCIR